MWVDNKKPEQDSASPNTLVIENRPGFSTPKHTCHRNQTRVQYPQTLLSSKPDPGSAPPNTLVIKIRPGFSTPKHLSQSRNCVIFSFWSRTRIRRTHFWGPCPKTASSVSTSCSQRLSLKVGFLLVSLWPWYMLFLLFSQRFCFLLPMAPVHQGDLQIQQCTKCRGLCPHKGENLLYSSRLFKTILRGYRSYSSALKGWLKTKSPQISPCSLEKHIHCGGNEHSILWNQKQNNVGT